MIMEEYLVLVLRIHKVCHISSMRFIYIIYKYAVVYVYYRVQECIIEFHSEVLQWGFPSLS